MSPLELLKDPQVVTSVALEAAKRLLGPTVEAWEPETIRLELSRRGIHEADSLMGKIMAAVTIKSTRKWVYDHDALFAFAVACCGVPGDSEALHHPTPEQLCWAMREIATLTGHTVDDDVGFDPDCIDPAIAAVLHDDGYVLAPAQLSFVQDSLDHLNKLGDVAAIKKSVKEAWGAIDKIPSWELHKKLDSLDDDAEEVQVRRLGDCKLYVAEHELLRARQHASINE